MWRDPLIDVIGQREVVANLREQNVRRTHPERCETELVHEGFDDPYLVVASAALAWRHSSLGLQPGRGQI